MAYQSILNWSGGKDSALALYHSLKDPQYAVGRLLTSINSTYARVTMHGVREVLLEQQARNIGLPLQKLMLPEQPGMEEYNRLMSETMEGLKSEGFTHSIFGDIFLEDLKKYREEQLAQKGFSAYFPLWKRDTTDLLHEFLDLGFKTILVCTKADVLDESFAGRHIDRDFLKDLSGLPAYVDPCGENGEFHTFVFDGPIFNKPVDFTVGEKVYREYRSPKEAGDDADAPAQAPMGFWFCDLLPVQEQGDKIL
ncbi:PP-loop superfamily ATP-utilizing enzyme [Flammeovirgaceae bacterium 311]|nr:PP-loop superfamily ATP-utilizing enzyme [Flammeovirgaceae bacterium 311]